MNTSVDFRHVPSVQLCKDVIGRREAFEQLPSGPGDADGLPTVGLAVRAPKTCPKSRFNLGAPALNMKICMGMRHLRAIQEYKVYGCGRYQAPLLMLVAPL